MPLFCTSWNRENRKKSEKNETKKGSFLLSLAFNKCSNLPFFLLQVMISLDEREEADVCGKAHVLADPNQYYSPGIMELSVFHMHTSALAFVYFCMCKCSMAS